MRSSALGRDFSRTSHERLRLTAMEGSEDECHAAEGEFLGIGTVCLGDANGNGIDDACEGHVIPAVSELGLAVMALFLLSAGTIVIGRSRRTPSRREPRPGGTL